jgi:very-short-patch-repair endonuclease
MSSNYNHYNKKLKPFARKLRNESTRSEVKLWCELLRNKQMKGYTFLRQRPVDDFIADFMQKELKLVLELDGYTHFDEEGYQRDMHKDQRLQALGFTVLRFNDEDVIQHLDAVRMKIEDVICSLTSPANATRQPAPPSLTHKPSRKGDD